MKSSSSMRRGLALAFTFGVTATGCAGILGDFTVGDVSEPGDDGSAGDDASNGGGSSDASGQDDGGGATADGAQDVTTDGVGPTDSQAQDSTTDSQASDGSTDSPVDSPVSDTGTGDACVAVDETTGIFVAPGGPSSSCGSRGTPCGSIQAAISVATQLTKPYVYVASGTYTETLSLAPNMTIVGGFVDQGGLWTRQCGGGVASDVVVKAPAGANTTVTASNVNGAGLDTLTIKSKDASAVGAGESIYGIFASSGAHVTLTNVAVAVVGGGVGAYGSTGASGSNTTTMGSACLPASSGAQGGPGSPGAAGTSAFGASGFTTATSANGTGGQAGTGLSGTAGGAGTTVTTYTCDDSGGVGPCTAINPVSSTGGTGYPGCGGGGSFGGTPASGGGSSIALYAWGATVTINGGSLASGAGGKGGDGGSGGTPGAGSSGQYGFLGTKGATSCSYNVNQICLAKTFGQGAGGTPGGNGGPGGVGGRGGGGAGGYSYSYYVGGGGTVTPHSTTLTFGAFGSGGAGGNAGPNGAAGPHN